MMGRACPGTHCLAAVHSTAPMQAYVSVRPASSKFLDQCGVCLLYSGVLPIPNQAEHRATATTTLGHAGTP